jgi:hypothetical protein
LIGTVSGYGRIHLRRGIGRARQHSPG